MNSPKKLFISLIIPAFRQESTIQKDLENIKNTMDQMRYEYEMIVVIDGKVDQTFENAKKVKSPHISVVGYEHNHGKGYAVRYGMVRSKGNIVGFIDSGMELNPNGLAMLLEHFEWYDADIIIGSKRHPVSKVKYPPTRKIISIASQVLIRLLFGLNIRDTQVGMKFFKRQVIEDVLPRLLVKKFAFDIEILVVAYHLGYRRIFEAPVELDFNLAGSLVSQHLFRSVMQTLWDTLAIFYRLQMLHYYDNENKRKWKYDKELDFPINVA